MKSSMIKLIKCTSGQGLSYINFNNEKEFVHISSDLNGIKVQDKCSSKVYTTCKGISINQQMDTMNRLHYLSSTNAIKSIDDLIPVLHDIIKFITNREIEEVILWDFY